MYVLLVLPSHTMVLHTQHILHTYIPGITHRCFTTGVLHTGALLLVYYILLLCYCGTTHHGIPTHGILPTEHTWWCITYRAYIHDIHTYTAYTPYIPCAPYTAMIRYILGMLSPHPCIMVYYMIPYTLYTTYIPCMYATTGYTHDMLYMGIHGIYYTSGIHVPCMRASCDTTEYVLTLCGNGITY